MEISIREVAPFRIVSLSGDVDLHSSPQARQAILDAIKQKLPLLVELDAVRYMDSSGVASLVEGYQAARKQGTEFGLAAVATPVMNVLKLARLDRVFPIHISVEARLTRDA